MSIHQTQKITCPKCKTTSDFEIWPIINGPLCKNKILDGSLFNFICPICNYSAEVNYDMTYLYGGMSIKYINANNPYRKPAYDDMFHHLKSFNGFFKGRTVQSINQIAEKVMIIDDNKDDCFIEILKYYLLKFENEKKTNQSYDYVLFNCLNNERRFLFHIKDNVYYPVEFPNKLYEVICQTYKEVVENSEETTFINQSWAERICAETEPLYKQKFRDIYFRQNSKSNSDQDELWSEKHQRHGGHWQAIFENSKNQESFFNLMRTAIQNPTSLHDIKTKVTMESGTAIRQCVLTKYSQSSTPIICNVGLVFDNDSNQVVTFSPSLNFGSEVIIQITEIHPWETGIEGWIKGIEQSLQTELTFFDTDFMLHKDEYKIGQTYKFSISAILFNAEVLEDDKTIVCFYGEDANIIRTRYNMPKEFDEKDNPKPFYILTKNMVSTIQCDYPADMEFQSPVLGKIYLSEFENTKILSNFEIIITRSFDGEKQLSVPVAVAFNNVSGMLKEGVALCGRLWLIGRLI